MSPSSNHVVLVSPLPPPVGGIAIWTETIQTRGFGVNWRISIVDARMRGKTVADQRTSVITEFSRTLRILLNLIRILVFDRPDVVHINSSLSERGVFRDALLVTVARLMRIPVITNLRGNFLPGKIVALSRRTETAYRHIFRRSNQIVALSNVSKNGVLQLGDFGSKTIVMPNFVDIEHIPQKQKPKSERLTVAYLGALIETKGLKTIYESAAQLPEVEFVLIGDSPERADSTDLTGKLSQLTNVTLTGSLPHSSALETIAGCDVLLLPSHTEGFPLAVAEAMAIGLAIVASPVGAIPEMVDTPKGGYLIPHEETDDYVNALRSLSSRPELTKKLGEHNREKSRSMYAYEDVIARWRDIYQSII
jgi:glycosyltransferase involved in cell wall biosynthesis